MYDRLIYVHDFVCDIKVVDDRIILDKTVLEQVSMWKKSKGLSDKAVAGHVCTGTKCSYHQIDDVFICEETGNVHGMIEILVKSFSKCCH